MMDRTMMNPSTVVLAPLLVTQMKDPSSTVMQAPLVVVTERRMEMTNLLKETKIGWPLQRV
jgi:hypothetical protein